MIKLSQKKILTVLLLSSASLLAVTQEHGQNGVHGIGPENSLVTNSATNSFTSKAKAFFQGHKLSAPIGLCCLIAIGTVGYFVYQKYGKPDKDQKPKSNN